jgi:hypothetical protein
MINQNNRNDKKINHNSCDLGTIAIILRWCYAALKKVLLQNNHFLKQGALSDVPRIVLLFLSLHNTLADKSKKPS